MKKFVWICTRPFYWFWKILSSGLSLLTNLIFVLCIVLALIVSFYEPEIKIPQGSALIVSLDGDIVEQRSPIDPATRVINELTGTPLHEETYLQDFLDALDAAGHDPRIRLVVLNLNRLGAADLNQIQSMGKALERFKQSGKRVIALGDRFNQAQYYLASWADKIYLNPMGSVNLRGFSVHRLYYKELLDKLAIDMHVFRVGTFKSAVEPLLRNSMSEEDRSANILWLNKLWNLYLADISQHRGLAPEVINDTVNYMVAQLTQAGGSRAELALRTGLVDGLKTHQELEAMLLAQVGPAQNGESFKQVDFRQYLRTITPSYTTPRQGTELIGIINVSGNIFPGEAPVGQIGAEDLIKKIRLARRNVRIKAIVLRINTGGGSAFASEQIRQELVQAQKEGKVVVISMGAMTASGGYWLAANADSIVAAPTTLTGSIGIFGAIPTLGKSLQKIGIHSDGIGTTAIAQFGNLTTDMSPPEKQALQMEVNQGYQQFVQLVAKGRNLSPEKVEALAQGRVWDGTTAKQLGLVDTLGDLETAIAEAAKLANVSPEQGYLIEPESSSIFARFKQVKQPVEALLHQLAPSSSWLPGLQQIVHGPLEFCFLRPDPNGLYAHSLLQDSEINLQ
nr:signal peptide peptidase SppA [uncultured Desulfobulbus sp.]